MQSSIHLTASAATLIGVALGGLLTGGFQGWMSRAQRRAAAAQAQRDRVWDHRAEVYLRVMAGIGAFEADHDFMFAERAPSTVRDWGPQITKLHELLAEQTAPIQAFASEPVRAAFDLYHRRLLLLAITAARSEAPEAGTVRDSIRDDLHEVMRTSEALIEAMRSDLQGTPHID